MFLVFIYFCFGSLFWISIFSPAIVYYLTLQATSEWLHAQGLILGVNVHDDDGIGTFEATYSQVAQGTMIELDRAGSRWFLFRFVLMF
jgi:hypothetical protein